MSTYATPQLTRIGSFKSVTKSLGKAPHNDIFRRPAVFVIYV
ncbi:lasso RiPP family leader peptide-containing protein [Cellulomonas sp. zg-ZUI222]|uniref:Lasso RiPP family leader peptide-containing protein n=1 Tax=Cellulomonas wangleii TaxID=2816956 RepID=A0ABX8D5N5_9CELL|nr:MULTISPECIES: lasso RiPP family leader peptide-containing protein [Cellulomonas]MBO0901799.1 lasso RiPP family leader peptide-containing protein [Cellulomonas sp. zg-ZUI22]MBO0922038.1 lasso RiPP family leader peptide-containing protein [Cellulomonas wangleii]MBO0926244.1 lasso RiPP family leader peptide-containing protein [Cellulomonas wangleii]QVI62750.1 lasso RiPP family leader peptide-containing protein [Cellulomonas wangleii]